MKLGLVVMAAGAGTRFGGGKLLAPFQGTPLYARALDAVPEGVFHRVAVVTAIEPMLSLAAARGFLPVVNDRPALGVSRTIALGLDALGDVDGAMFLAADQPLLRPETVRRLAETFRAHPAAIVAPAAAGRRGGPCTFPRRLTGDQGGAAVIRAEAARLLLVEVPAAELWDADTPQALQALERAECP